MADAAASAAQLDPRDVESGDRLMRQHPELLYADDDDQGGSDGGNTDSNDNSNNKSNNTTPTTTTPTTTTPTTTAKKPEGAPEQFVEAPTREFELRLKLAEAAGDCTKEFIGAADVKWRKACASAPEDTGFADSLYTIADKRAWAMAEAEGIGAGVHQEAGQALSSLMYWMWNTCPGAYVLLADTIERLHACTTAPAAVAALSKELLEPHLGGDSSPMAEMAAIFHRVTGAAEHYISLTRFVELACRQVHGDPGVAADRLGWSRRLLLAQHGALLAALPESVLPRCAGKSALACPTRLVVAELLKKLPEIKSKTGRAGEWLVLPVGLNCARDGPLPPLLVLPPEGQGVGGGGDNGNGNEANGKNGNGNNSNRVFPIGLETIRTATGGPTDLEVRRAAERLHVNWGKVAGIVITPVESVLGNEEDAIDATNGRPARILPVYKVVARSLAGIEGRQGYGSLLRTVSALATDLAANVAAMASLECDSVRVARVMPLGANAQLMGNTAHHAVLFDLGWCAGQNAPHPVAGGYGAYTGSTRRALELQVHGPDRARLVRGDLEGRRKQVSSIWRENREFFCRGYGVGPAGGSGRESGGWRGERAREGKRKKRGGKKRRRGAPPAFCSLATPPLPSLPHTQHTHTPIKSTNQTKKQQSSTAKSARRRRWI